MRNRFQFVLVKNRKPQLTRANTIKLRGCPQPLPSVGDEKAYNNVELCYSHGRVSDS